MNIRRPNEIRSDDNYTRRRLGNSVPEEEEKEEEGKKRALEKGHQAR